MKKNLFIGVLVILAIGLYFKPPQIIIKTISKVITVEKNQEILTEEILATVDKALPPITGEREISSPEKERSKINKNEISPRITGKEKTEKVVVVPNLKKQKPQGREWNNAIKADQTAGPSVNVAEGSGIIATAETTEDGTNVFQFQFPDDETSIKNEKGTTTGSDATTKIRINLNLNELLARQ